MKTTRRILLLVFLPLISMGQDADFLNTNQSLISLNPSFAGSSGGLRDQLSYTDDRSGYYRFATLQNTMDFYVKPLKAGIGLSLVLDDAYMITTGLVQLSYAQHLQIGAKTRLSPAVSISYGQRNPNEGKFLVNEDVDARFSFVWNQQPVMPLPKRYLDAATSILLTHDNLYSVGAAVFHITQPDIGVSGTRPLPARLLIHGSYTLEFDRHLLQFMGLTQFQGRYSLQQLSVQSVLFKHFLFGTGFNTDEMLSVNAGYRNNLFSIVAGYGSTFRKLLGSVGSAWEVHSAISIKKKELRNPSVSFENW
jgi:type IX secretion system PorP/SprF family membrane protein